MRKNNGENFPNFAKGINPQIQEGKQIPNRINSKKFTPRYITVNLQKLEANTLEAATEKTPYLGGKTVR